MQTTIVLGAEDVAALVENVGVDRLMSEVIESLSVELARYDTEAYTTPARSGFRYDGPSSGLVEWMPVHRHHESVTIKVVGYHPSNPERRNLPTILSTISRYDTADGHLQGIADATFLTALRTGATSAVASRLLARPGSTVFGMIGCGAQAVTQLHAMVRIFPVQTVLVHDVDRARCESFADRISSFAPPGLDIRFTPIPEMLREADVLCTSTSLPVGSGPLFEDQETRPWLHINAVGSDFPGKSELPVSLLRRSLVCPDFLEQAMAEGECQQLLPHEVGPSLADLVRNPDSAAPHQLRSTVFDSTGWALTDHVTLGVFLRHARRVGLGTELHLESTGADPYAPYELTPRGADREAIETPPTAELVD